MRCYICNTALEPNEIKINKLSNDFDPCGTCKNEVRSIVNSYDSEYDKKLGILFELDKYYRES